MGTLRQALIEAITMYRPAAVKWTLYGKWEAVELNEDAFAGRCDFIIEENGALPLPQNDEASKALADLIYEGIGYTFDENPTPKAVPKFLRDAAAKRAKTDDDAETTAKKKPKLKRGKIKKRPLTKRR